MKMNIKTLFSLFAVFLLVFGAFGEAYAKGGGGGGRGGGGPTSVVTPMSEKCRRDRLPYSYCRSRGYWHPDQDRYAHNDSGSGAVVAGIATGVAVGALLSSNNSNAASSQTVVVQSAPTASGAVSAPVTTTATQPQPLIKPFTLINDCSDWVCK